MKQKKMKPVVKIFGDSHTLYFRQVSMKPDYLSYRLAEYDLEVEVYQAASVKGFGNRNSTLNTMDKVINQVEADDIVVLNFGQVDIELGIFYKLIVKEENIAKAHFIRHCINAYRVLLKSLMKKTSRIILKGCNSPVLIDQFKAIKYVERIITENISNVDDLAKSRGRANLLYPDIFERIGLMRKFNNALKKMASELEIGYFDINDDICYPSGMVKEQYIPASFDHHLVDSMDVRLIHQKALVNTLDKL